MDSHALPRAGTNLGDCHQGKQLLAVQLPKPLTCTFAPLAGLEPATYGLEVRHDPSDWCHRGASALVGSGSSSDQWHRGRFRDNDRIATWIASVIAGA